MKMFLVAACVLMVVVGSLSSSSPTGRTMPETEAWTLYGGAAENYKCVGTDTGCVNDYPDPCGTYPYEECFMQIEILNQPGNELKCATHSDETSTCGEQGSHACLKYRGCQWDVGMGVCVPHPTTYYYHTVPEFVAGSACF